MNDESSNAVITVASTTDDQSAVQSAANGAAPPHEPTPPAEPVAVRSTTDSATAIAEVERDLQETKEARRDEYLDQGVGKSRRKLIRQVQRLNQKLEKYERQPIPTHPDAPAQFEPPEQAQPSGEEQYNQQQQPGEALPPLSPEEQAAFARSHANRQSVAELTETAAAKYPDLDKRLSECGAQHPVPAPVPDLLMELQNPFEVGYFLSGDTAAIAKLWNIMSSQPYPQAIRAVRRELKQLSKAVLEHERTGGHRTAPRQEERQHSTPAPVRHLGGGSSSQAMREEDMPWRQWADKKTAEERRRNR